MRRFMTSPLIRKKVSGVSGASKGYLKQGVKNDTDN